MAAFAARLAPSAAIITIFWISAGHTHPLRELYAEFLANAVAVPSNATAQLCEAAKKAGVAVAIGINEVNSEASGTTIYNTLHPGDPARHRNFDRQRLDRRRRFAQVLARELRARCFESFDVLFGGNSALSQESSQISSHSSVIASPSSDPEG
jgi:hypothetical protein